MKKLYDFLEEQRGKLPEMFFEQYCEIIEDFMKQEAVVFEKRAREYAALPAHLKFLANKFANDAASTTDLMRAFGYDLARFKTVSPHPAKLSKWRARFKDRTKWTESEARQFILLEDSDVETCLYLGQMFFPDLGLSASREHSGKSYKRLVEHVRNKSAVTEVEITEERLMLLISTGAISEMTVAELATLKAIAARGEVYPMRLLPFNKPASAWLMILGGRLQEPTEEDYALARKLDNTRQRYLVNPATQLTLEQEWFSKFRNELPVFDFPVLTIVKELPQTAWDELTGTAESEDYLEALSRLRRQEFEDFEDLEIQYEGLLTQAELSKLGELFQSL